MLVLSGCGESQSATGRAPSIPEVGVTTLAAQPLSLNAELSGRTSAFMVAQIRPQIGGIVLKRAFTEGALVKAGELLYQIDPASYQAIRLRMPAQMRAWRAPKRRGCRAPSRRSGNWSCWPSRPSANRTMRMRRRPCSKPKPIWLRHGLRFRRQASIWHEPGSLRRSAGGSRLPQ